MHEETGTPGKNERAGAVLSGIAGTGRDTHADSYMAPRPVPLFLQQGAGRLMGENRI